MTMRYVGVAAGAVVAWLIAHFLIPVPSTPEERGLMFIAWAIVLHALVHGKRG